MEQEEKIEKRKSMWLRLRAFFAMGRIDEGRSDDLA